MTDNLDKIRYHLAQCDPDTEAAWHLKKALEAMHQQLEGMMRFGTEHTHDSLGVVKR